MGASRGPTLTRSSTLLGLVVALLLLAFTSHATACSTSGGPSSFLEPSSSATFFAPPETALVSRAPQEEFLRGAASRARWCEEHTYFVAGDARSAVVWVHNGGDVEVNKDVGDRQSRRIARRYKDAKLERSFQTKGGPRRYDVYVKRSKHGIESKVGRTGLTKRTRQELARDIRLLRQGRLKKVTWEFSRSRATGKSGPTKALADSILNAAKKGLNIAIKGPRK